METGAEVKVLVRGDPVPLDLLVRSNLVQQELTRLGIKSIAQLSRTVNVAPDVMLKLRDLLDREVERQAHEWMETMQRMTVTEKTEKRPVTIRSRGVEQDCRSIVSQLVNSMPKDVLLRTSLTEHRTSTQVQANEEIRVKSKYSFTRKVNYTSDEEGTVVDNAADGLELIAVSKRPTKLVPHSMVVRTNLEPSVQEATPLTKIWCVKLMDDADAPEVISGQLNVVKTYLKARYRLSDLLRAQQNDRMTSNLKRWIENGAPDKGDLEEDSYKILKQLYLKRKDLRTGASQLTCMRETI